MHRCKCKQSLHHIKIWYWVLFCCSQRCSAKVSISCSRFDQGFLLNIIARISRFLYWYAWLLRLLFRTRRFSNNVGLEFTMRWVWSQNTQPFVSNYIQSHTLQHPPFWSPRVLTQKNPTWNLFFYFILFYFQLSWYIHSFIYINKQVMHCCQGLHCHMYW